ncbi:MFS transporter [Nonomuraea wenchangensis]
MAGRPQRHEVAASHGQLADEFGEARVVGVTAADQAQVGDVGLGEVVPTNGLLLTLADEFAVPVATTGLLTTGYAAGIVVGGPVLAALTLRKPRKRLLMTLMVIFILGNTVCALAPFFGILLAGRFVSAISHGAFFGAASVVAASLVPAGRRAAAIALLFTGLTLANVLGMPLGTFVGPAACRSSCRWRC